MLTGDASWVRDAFARAKLQLNNNLLVYNRTIWSTATFPSKPAVLEEAISAISDYPSS